MNRSSYLHSLAVFSLSASLLLAGCGLATSNFGAVGDLPTTADPAPSVAPPLQGSVFGGHAPIVGAQVYILTPSSSASSGAGIAASTATLATSIMCSDSPAAACTATGSGNGSVSTSTGSNGFHYITTDSNGTFDLTGDYRCTVNTPVYIAALGGTPTYPSASNVFSTSSLVVNTAPSDGSTGYQYTLNLNQSPVQKEFFYVGEYVTLSGFASPFTAFNGTTVQVLATNLTTTTFAFDAAKNTSVSAQSYTAAGTVTALPTYNPAIMNMAALGICPSSGNFSTAGNGALSYVYMNEVSTTAAAYALAGFGTDAFHIGTSTSGASNNTPTNSTTSRSKYAYNGMALAMLNAGLIYDIQGGNVTTTSAGEGHIARVTTPSGNGAVPQAELDTLGNILAACVDSQNTTTTVSAQCGTLFSYATSTGTPCTPNSGTAPTCPSGTTAPTDTATAVFNIAHYPAGINSSTFVTKIYDIPTGNVPFTPNLSSCTSGTAGCPASGVPNDFSVVVAYTVPSSSGGTDNLLAGPAFVAVDGGNYIGTEGGTGSFQEALWISNAYGTPVKVFANGGVPDYATNTKLKANAYANTVQQIAIDNNNNPWAPAGSAVYELSPLTGAISQTITSTGNPGLSGASGVTFDLTGAYLYVANYGNRNILKFDTSGNNYGPNTATSTTGVWSSGANSCLSTTTVLQGGVISTTGGAYSTAVDENGNLFAVNNASNDLCVLGGPSGTLFQTFSNGEFLGTYAPPVVDVNGAVINPSSTTNEELFVFGPTAADKSKNGTEYTYANGTTGGNNGGLDAPSAVTADGGGNNFYANAGNESLSEWTTNASYWYSPAGGYGPLAAPITSYGGYPAADRAGSVWVVYQGAGANNTNLDYLYQYIGLAVPTVTPLSVALQQSLIGKHP